MRCSKVTRRIESYLGGTLNSREKAAFDKHFEGCESCRKELERCMAENKLYRRALEGQRLKDSVRNSVLSRLRHAYTSVRQRIEAQPKKTLWIAPVAAVAQFLIAFWLSGVLFLGGAPEKMDIISPPSGKIVTIHWAYGFGPHGYVYAGSGQALPGPEIAEKDARVD